jgi:hypothetical protein
MTTGAEGDLISPPAQAERLAGEASALAKGVN